ncbi:hypothetical protein GCM10010387_50160 [Streptomyces inusitatus]|uniref:Uncharacterized protein n=1 Tax=Streptomyces inusitatus TaxID=68221 RepID=A0A918V0B5_9ACTN|nr:hypothetical protein GCM10010387_50160 [Streptomyces inusitatus]
MIADFRLRIIEQADELVEILGHEGHPPTLARWELSCIAEAMAPAGLEQLSTLMDRRMEAAGRRIRLVRKADGVVCLSPPQNATMSNGCMGLWALAAGNALIVGPPQRTTGRSSPPARGRSRGCSPCSGIGMSAPPARGSYGLSPGLSSLASVVPARAGIVRSTEPSAGCRARLTCSCGAARQPGRPGG